MGLSKMCSRCGKIIRLGETCTCSRHSLYDKDRDKKYKEFYHSNEWTKTSKMIRDKYMNIDIYYLYKYGRIIPSDMVHHIVPLKEDWSKRLDVDNLIALSQASHNEIEAMYRKSSSHKRITAKYLLEIKEKFDRGDIKKVFQNKI